MAEYRYWRLPKLSSTNGAPVSLSACHLLNGNTRVDQSATLTSSIAPLSGLLADLQDGDLNTICTLAPSTTLTWDFGTPTELQIAVLGAADSKSAFPVWAELFGSSDGVNWVSMSPGGNCVPKWPGVRTMMPILPNGRWVRSSRYVIDSADARLVSVSAAPGGSWAVAAPFKSSGVLQFEVVTTGNLQVLVGIEKEGTTDGYLPGQNAGVSVLLATGQKYQQTLSSYTTALSSGDALGIVVDFSTGTVTGYVNGVSRGVLRTGIVAGNYAPTLFENTGGVRSHYIRTSNFLFPIAGATAWDATFYTEQSSVVDLSSENLWINSAGAMPEVVLGSSYDSTLSALRGNYLFDPKAKGRIAANVRGKGTPNFPLSRRVRLYRERDGMFIAQTWSDAQGNYQFDYIEEGEVYTVISHDYMKTYRAAVSDGLVPTIIED